MALSLPLLSAKEVYYLTIYGFAPVLPFKPQTENLAERIHLASRAAIKYLGVLDSGGSKMSSGGIV